MHVNYQFVIYDFGKLLLTIAIIDGNQTIIIIIMIIINYIFN